MRGWPLIVLVACTSPPPAPAWRVDGGFLHEPDGRTAILRGVNLSGAQKNAPYIDEKSLADYQRVSADWGFDAIRFVMTWAAIEPEAGVYDETYLDQVADRMEWARVSGLAVILDMHEDIFGEGFGFDGAPAWACDASNYAAFVAQTPWYINSLDPNVEACVDAFYTDADTRAAFMAAWSHVAQRLATAPAIVGFDPLNEPSWGTYPVFAFERDRLVPLYADVVAAVRAAAPDWVAFAEPSSSRNVGLESQIQTLPFDNAMYAPHSYDQGAESGAGFDPTHRTAILENVAELETEATTMKAGLWIGEYGGVATDPGITDYMSAEYDAAGSAAAGAMYWAYDRSDGYGLLDPDGNEKPALVAAVVRPYPARVAGSPISYAFDPSSTTFTLIYSPDRSGAATEIAIPPRVYPNGYTVDCGGCSSHDEPGRLVIDSPGAGDPLTITVQ